MIKLVKEQKKSQLKYQMVLYTIKNLLPIKDPVVLTIPLKFCKDSSLEKTALKGLGKME